METRQLRYYAMLAGTAVIAIVAALTVSLWLGIALAGLGSATSLQFFRRSEPIPADAESQQAPGAGSHPPADDSYWNTH